MAQVGGAGSVDGIPGLAYQPNNGMAGGVMQRGWNEIPCNTTVYNGQPGTSFPDSSGCDPECRVAEFWPSARTGMNR